MNPQLPDGYVWKSCNLGIQNFPYQEDFPNSGTRSIYIPNESDCNFQFRYEFPVKENTKVYDYNLNQSTINHPIFLTKDSKLYRGRDIGLSKKALILTKYSIDNLSCCGYIPISSIIKPSPVSSGRLNLGSTAQEIIGEYFKSINPSVTYITNSIGSNSTDVILNVNNKSLNVEVKGSNGGLSSIHTLFDKSVRRDKPVSSYLEYISEGYCESFEINNSGSWFISLIDYFRSKNNSIGLVGDSGVIKSGKLPRELMSTNEQLLDRLYHSILNHFNENNDHYFCILNRKSNSIHSYFVGLNDDDNIFNFKCLPKLSYGGLMTYGGPSSGSTRIAFKVKFKDE